MAYAVSVTNADVSEGIGPVRTGAKTEDAAKEALATQNGLTVDELEAMGLTVWMIVPLNT